MRTADKADPDPELMTVALRIWPLMLVITITDLVFLVYMAGLSGGYVFVAIAVNFLTTYVVLWKTTKVTQKEDSGDRKDHIAKEEIPRLAIENENDAPSEDKEEPENDAIQMSLLAAGTSKESQEGEKHTEAKAEDKNEANVAQMQPLPPSSEMPGTGTSKDIESQEEEKQTEAVLENESKDMKSGREKKTEKGGEESFLITASVCSTWIPSVVGDPEQRYFLKAGEPLQCIGVSLVSQNVLLSFKFTQVL